MMGVFVQVNEESPNADKWPIGYVIEESGCWTWVGATNGRGYGSLRVAGRPYRAHRWVYEKERGVIPPDLVLDHLCRNKACRNSTPIPRLP